MQNGYNGSFAARLRRQRRIGAGLVLGGLLLGAVSLGAARYTGDWRYFLGAVSGYTAMIIGLPMSTGIQTYRN